MARVKKKAHENLTPTNLRKVQSLLTPLDCKPITKKHACELLNISYNTTRLTKILDEFREHEEFVATRKAQNRGKRASDGEIREVIGNYLEGDPVSTIAARLFRSPGFVKAIIQRVGVPFRGTSAEERSHIALLPENCMAEDFRTGVIVWSAKYHAPAVVKQCISGYQDKYESDVYQIYVIERTDSSGSYFEYVESGGFYAYAPAYDLGSLEHLEIYGIDLNRI